MTGSGYGRDLPGLVLALAEIAHVRVDDVDDEHARWRLYQRAGDVPGAHELLQAVVVVEPEAPVASALVVMMLERVKPVERAQWCGLLPDSVRSFAEVRSRELGVFESLRDGDGSDDLEPGVVDRWTDWLQLKVARSVPHSSVLEQVAAHGRTKRIRRVARENLER